MKSIKKMHVISATILLLMSISSKSQVPENAKIERADCAVSDRFFNYANQALFNDNTDCGTFPLLTCPIAEGLMAELALDSATFYFDRLAYPLFIRESLNHHHLRQSVNYFKTNRSYYGLLASSIHWSPDLRLLALAHLYELQTTYLDDHPTTAELEKHQQINETISNFLIYVLENTTWEMSGSENVTIQEINRQYMAKILDFTVYGRIQNTANLQDHNYTITPLKIENWKKRIK